MSFKIKEIWLGKNPKTAIMRRIEIRCHILEIVVEIAVRSQLTLKPQKVFNARDSQRRFAIDCVSAMDFLVGLHPNTNQD